MKLGSRTVAVLALALVSPVAMAKKDKKKKKKKGEEEVVLVGWQTQEGWAGSCYHPPQWDKLSSSETKLARQEVLEGMYQQWTGTKDDGISFDEEMVIEVETVLLGRPDKIDDISIKNRDRCIAVMSGKSSASEWGSWLAGLRASLTEGECKQPLDYTMFDYLDIGAGWQRPLSICADETIRLSGTLTDKYRVSNDGEWITVVGDKAQSAVGLELPCNVEGCLVGQLIMKFEADTGWERIYPVGQKLIFTAQEHGVISYRINDDTFFDNEWFKSRGIEDHTAIEVSPATP